MLPSVSAVIFNDRGEVLLGRRTDNGRWSLIAGTIDPGEQPSEAMLREAYEEAGIRIAIDRVAGVGLHPVTYPNGDVCQFLNVWFRCRVVSGVARVNDDESDAMAWFAVDALPDVGPWSNLRIRTALPEHAPAWFAAPGESHDGLASPADI